jgi:EAL domain-containing protein (putative c-di-GMP-specific phosphodiesterase class I)
MSLFLLLILLAVMALNFQSSTRYAEAELANNAQNTASSLSLSLANAQGDLSTMATMIDALFDSGYFQKIILRDTNSKLIHERLMPNELSEIPQWFRSLYTLKSPLASATVSSGWNPIGTITIIPLQENAHIKLYENFRELLQSFALISLITFSLLYLLLRLLLSSLKRVKEQAEAVSNNNFIINTKIPSTAEFKEVTLAMNKMVTKVKDIFAREADSARENHRLLYKDKLTGLGNRNFFELKLNEFISSEEADSKGTILTLYIEGIVEANRILGHDNVDSLIKELSQRLVRETQEQKQVVIARIDGTKISLIFPRMQKDDIEKIADDILAKAIMTIEASSAQDCECAVKLLQLNYTAQDTVPLLLDKIEKELSYVQKNSVSSVCSHENRDNIDRKIVENRIKEHSIALALQDVYDLDGNIFHSEAYVRLYDEDKNLHTASDFIPLVHKMRLDTKLDQNVINYALKEDSLQEREIAFNLSLRFIEEPEMLQWLKERLAGLSGKKVLNFELSNRSLLGSLKEAFALAAMLRQSGHNFGIDRFSIEEESNLNYLQMLKPKYIKIDSIYLHDMLQGREGHSNPALQILIESLDITIIATNLEDQTIKEALQATGIKYFQGSLLGKPKLI